MTLLISFLIVGMLPVEKKTVISFILEHSDWQLLTILDNQTICSVFS